MEPKMPARGKTSRLDRSIRISVVAALLLGTSGVLVLSARSRAADSNLQQVPKLSAQDRLARSEFYAHMLGLEFGVPANARRNAIAQSATMSLAAAVTATTNLAWNSIGPLPMTEASNFGGVIVGPAVAMSGRASAMAVDPANASNLAVGGANGGIWLSTDAGTTFKEVFDSEPSQAIGALAVDTSTSPSTMWAGTGEGHNSVDSYYGQGLSDDPTSAAHGLRSAALIGSHSPRSPWTTRFRRHIFLATGNGNSGGRLFIINENRYHEAGCLSFNGRAVRRSRCMPDQCLMQCSYVASRPADVAAAAVGRRTPTRQRVHLHDAGATWNAASFPGLTLGPGSWNQTFRQSVAIGKSNALITVGDASGIAYQFLHVSNSELAGTPERCRAQT